MSSSESLVCALRLWGGPWVGSGWRGTGVGGCFCFTSAVKAGGVVRVRVRVSAQFSVMARVGARVVV